MIATVRDRFQEACVTYECSTPDGIDDRDGLELDRSGRCVLFVLNA